jgi:L-fuconolactonase
VILDHLARGGQGTATEYNEVLKLAKLKRVVMKYSGVAYSSKEPYPHRDAAPLVRRVYDAFGPDRIVWGSFGSTLQTFNRNAELLDQMFKFAGEADRAAIRGGNAVRIYGFAKRG